MDWFAPYDPRVAARWLCVAVSVFSAVPLLTVDGSASAAGIWVPLLVSALCLAVAAATLRGWLPQGRAWALCLAVSTTLIVLSDLATRDATATGLVVFLAPTVLAAAQLRRSGAWTTTAATSFAVLVVCTSLLPRADALVTWGSVSGVAALLTALLAHSAHLNHQLTAELRHQAAVDPLTGLVTRRVLDGALDAALRGAAVDRGSALLLLDVDHFKSVNDFHGHQVGDEVLRRTAEVLARAVGEAAVVGRLGGDELAALLPGASLDDAAAAARAVVEAVRSSPVRLPGSGSVPVTVSVGAAHSPTHATDSRALYRAADEALYAAKRAGRDRWSVRGPDEQGSGARGPAAPSLV